MEVKKMSLMDWAKDYKGEVPPYLTEEADRLILHHLELLIGTSLSVDRGAGKVPPVAVHGSRGKLIVCSANVRRKP